MTTLRNAVTQRRGQSGIVMVEYLILVGFIAVLCMIAVWNYGEHVEAGICNQTSTLDGIDVQAPACAAPEEFSPDVDPPDPPDPPDPRELTDHIGCDLPFGNFFSGVFGSCCDTHDHCFYVNDCTAASWLCSPEVCAAVHDRFGLTGSECAALVSNPPLYALCLQGGFDLGHICDAFASDPAECRPEDVSAVCGQCDVAAANCILDGPNGPSACVAEGNCQDSRPPGCVVQPNGQCG